MNKQKAQELLKRYHDGTCTPAEKARLDAWFLTLSIQPKPLWLEEEKNAIADDLKARIDENIKPSKPRIFNSKYILAAASLILVCGAALFLFKYKTPILNKVDPIAYTETYVEPGKRMKLALSDGSTIVLNGGSRLRYPKTFGRSTREVSLLEGEAFFDIKHDDKKMFIVEALGTHTYVLGTAFNIRAYKLSKEIQITVARGKVYVKGIADLKRKESESVTLLPDEQVSIVKQNGEMAQRHISAADYTVWIQGKYKFSNETLGNVAVVLENSFRVHMEFTDAKLKDIRFSSEFNSHDKLDDLLFAICKANNLSYKIKNNQVILTTKHNQ